MRSARFGICGAVALWAAAFVLPAAAQAPADKPDAPCPPFKIGEGLY